MSPSRLIPNANGWQLILADLALILFLVTLAALPSSFADGNPEGERSQKPTISASQALYRPIAGGPTLREWLGDQPRDPRATLTIFATYRPGGEAQAWQASERLVSSLNDPQVAVRTIISLGRENHIYASLAYDSVADSADSTF
jgi:hypothetical protein